MNCFSGTIAMGTNLYFPPTHTILKGLSPKEVNAQPTSLVLANENCFVVES
jgi:hypothetical protein